MKSLTFFLFSLLVVICTVDNSSAQQILEVEKGSYFPEPQQSDTTDIIESEKLSFFIEDVVEGLDIPWGMAFLPNGNVLITEREGDIHIVEEGQLRPEPISGVPAVVAEGQGGLLDIELHPNYEENGWIYYSYSNSDNNEGAATTIERARLNGYEFTDHEEIYTGNQFSETRHHFGSRIEFDGDGYLFFSIGDRGDMETAQDLSVSNGSVFRLHDDGSIPEENPFVGEEGLDEIFSYGHRNIQGMAVHPETKEIWTHEHGPRGGDEINKPEKGLNYGWPEISYGINYDGSVLTEDTAKAGLEQPVLQWTPSIAPSGMAFVTGERYPGWEGSIMNGALSFQLLSRVELDGDEFSHEERLLDGIGRIRAVTMGPDGYLYFSNESEGVISRIVPAE